MSDSAPYSEDHAQFVEPLRKRLKLSDTLAGVCSAHAIVTVDQARVFFEALLATEGLIEHFNLTRDDIAHALADLPDPPMAVAPFEPPLSGVSEQIKPPIHYGLEKIPLAHAPPTPGDSEAKSETVSDVNSATYPQVSKDEP